MNFVHLHVHTAYSLLDGACDISKLITRVKQLGMKSIAITDHGNMFGVIQFYKEALKQNIKPIIGCEVYLAPKSRHDRKEFNGRKYFHLILLAKNNVGYKNLVKLVSFANVEGFYYKPRIDKDLLRQYHDGLICLSACVAGEIPVAIQNGNMELASKLVDEYVEIFGADNFFLEIQNHDLESEKIVRDGIMKLSAEKNIPIVATNDLHYINKEDSEFHDAMLCVQLNKTIDSTHRLKFNNDSYYLKSPAEMHELFKDYLDAVENTNRIAEMCNVEIKFNEIHLPNFQLPKDFQSAHDFLKYLCEKNLPMKYSELNQLIHDRLDYELKTINQMGFDEYFLIVQDFIHWAKSKNIAVGPGRGSAAGSIVAYLLGITEIDPLKFNLLFERFLNPARISMPDIDVDFCFIRRDEVIEYVRKKYGEDHVSQIATFGTFAAKAAIRDIGRVYNLNVSQTNNMTKYIPNNPNVTIDQSIANSPELKQMYENNPTAKKIINIAKHIEGLPRHVSTHAAGVVISKIPLTDIVPVQTADLVGKTKDLVTQYDKDQIEDLGLLKMDFLGLRTLTVITDTVENIKHHQKIAIDLSKIPTDDQKTGQMLCDGKTGAVFQMESNGMTKLVLRLKPRCFEDLIPLIALFRPGPLGSGMVEDYINRRKGIESIDYLHPALESILKETYGIILYQEQVMQIVQILAGFSLEQADLLRRAIGKKKPDIILAQRENFLNGCRDNKIDSTLAEKIFDLLEKFADYGFNKSHSVAYAVIAWQTAFLKSHYTAEYMSAVLTNFSDTDKIGHYVEQSHKMFLEILQPDINSSQTKFTVADKKSIRFGLSAVKGVGSVAADHIIEVRTSTGKFTSLSDFARRIDLKICAKHAVESLIKAGAFDSIDDNRFKLINSLDTTFEEANTYKSEKKSGLINLFGDDEFETESVAITEKYADESLLNEWEKSALGFLLSKKIDKADKIISIQDINRKNLSSGDVVKFHGTVNKCVEGRFSAIFVTDSKKTVSINATADQFQKFKNILNIGDNLIFQCTVENKSGAMSLQMQNVFKNNSINVTQN